MVESKICSYCNCKRKFFRENQSDYHWGIKQYCNKKCKVNALLKKKNWYSKNKHPDKKTQFEAHSKFMKENNPMFKKQHLESMIKNLPRGRDHPNWCERRITERYIYIKMLNHPFASCKGEVLEHRLVVERWLRENKPDSYFLIELDGEKYLKREVVVHHIDHNKKNNNIDNLHCFSCREEHMSYHGMLRYFVYQITNRGGSICQKGICCS